MNYKLMCLVRAYFGGMQLIIIHVWYALYHLDRQLRLCHIMEAMVLAAVFWRYSLG